MAAISRDEVAHLARLSRLAVTDEELDDVRRPARRDPAVGRAGRRGRRRRHSADVALGAADQCAARRRGASGPDPARRRCPARPTPTEGRFRVPRILDEEA